MKEFILMIYYLRLFYVASRQVVCKNVCQTDRLSLQIVNPIHLNIILKGFSVNKKKGPSGFVLPNLNHSQKDLPF